MKKLFLLLLLIPILLRPPKSRTPMNYAKITALEYKDQAAAESVAKSYVDELIPKYHALGAIGLMAVCVVSPT